MSKIPQVTCGCQRWGMSDFLDEDRVPAQRAKFMETHGSHSLAAAALLEEAAKMAAQPLPAGRNGLSNNITMKKPASADDSGTLYATSPTLRKRAATRTGHCSGPPLTPVKTYKSMFRQVCKSKRSLLGTPHFKKKGCNSNRSLLGTPPYPSEDL